MIQKIQSSSFKVEALYPVLLLLLGSKRSFYEFHLLYILECPETHEGRIGRKGGEIRKWTTAWFEGERQQEDVRFRDLIELVMYGLYLSIFFYCSHAR